MKLKVSIFIPTKNAGPEFSAVLERIYNQKEDKIEVIIVDSGSTDGTLAIAEKFQVKIVTIKPEEFGHGKTRNLVLTYSSADHIVFLSQDAIPSDECWLSNLLTNFTDEKIAGVFSRQIPKEDARELQKFFYKYYFPKDKVVRPLKEFNSIQNRFFSNVSSCIKKDILQKYPFSDTILTTEDQEWAKRITDLGYKTVYEPQSIVIHSHNYNLRQIFKGYFDSASALCEITKQEYGEFRSGSMVYFVKELRYILNHKPAEIPYLVLYNIVKIPGIFLGLNEKSLPLILKKKLSLNKYYWEKRI